MLKYVVLFATVFCLVQSQRPWHGGSGDRLPMVLPQYLDERAAAAQAAQSSQSGQLGPAGQPGSTVQPGQSGQPGQPGQLGQSGQPGLSSPENPSGLTGMQPVASTQTPFNNRFGPNDASSTINPQDLPIDAHGDINLINRIKTWPRDQQPFWYLNWQAIQAHRGDVNNPAQPSQTQPNSRSFFAG